MSLSPAHQDLIDKLETNLETGLTSDQATQRREQDGCFNVVRPPIDLPNWMCILLPCLKNIASMKAFSAIKPDDAEVLRAGKWIRYDAASLVKGDVIRLEEGDVVPADCVVVQVEEGELLVDVRAVAGDERLRSCISSTTDKLVQLYLGSHVVQGSATAVITAIGPNTLLAKLIKEKRFPPKESVVTEEVDEAEVSLTAQDEIV